MRTLSEQQASPRILSPSQPVKASHREQPDAQQLFPLWSPSKPFRHGRVSSFRHIVGEGNSFAATSTTTREEVQNVIVFVSAIFGDLAGSERRLPPLLRDGRRRRRKTRRFTIPAAASSSVGPGEAVAARARKGPFGIIVGDGVRDEINDHDKMGGRPSV